MKKWMLFIAALLICALFTGALAETANDVRLALEANPTTGYEWTAFVLSGDSAQLLGDGAGEYVSDPQADAPVAGAGGQTVFTLRPVQPGFTLVRFTYLRPWSGEVAEERVYLAYVDDALAMTLEDVTENGVIEGVVVSIDADGAVLLSTDKLGDIIARFPEEMALPTQDERVILYTNGVMTMSLPGMVNVLAWETVAPDMAREAASSLFDELTGFSAFTALITEENPIVSAFFSEGDELNTHFTTEDPAEIEALLQAVSALEIESVSDELITDWYPILRFTAQNGEEWSVGFEGHWLSTGRVNYNLANEPAFRQVVRRLEAKYAEEE